MKLGLLVPRYGTEVVGGTEHWLRLLCEHLVALRGWDVEVFTTGALSAATWADELPVGTETLAGVVVHRHHCVSGRDPRYLEINPVIRSAPELVPDDLAWRFIELVGPVCPDAVTHALDSACDLVAVTPYVFWPAVRGVPALGQRAVLHGAAHDEPEIHLPLMAEVFTSVGGLAYNSYAEQAVVERAFAVAHLPACVLGAGVVEVDGDPATARIALGLDPDEPFVLCVGRVERAKGAHVLADMWRVYRARRPRAPRLVFVGPVHEPLEADEHVVLAGKQPESVKWGALRSCDLVISPSAWESFSLVVVEAWLAGAAVVVNGRCEATREHIRRGRGGLPFVEYADFEAVVDRLLADAELRRLLADTGRRYAAHTFAWPAIVDRYEHLTRRVLGRRATARA